jgi:hypothetical protein
MSNQLSRRSILAAACAAGTSIFSPRILFAKDQVPVMLDHILLGSNDLDAGIAYLEKRSGVRAALGGVHPGRGTRNALLSLGELHYLEVIAPDPGQPGAPDIFGLRPLTEPRLVTWAVHISDIGGRVGRLADAGIPFEGPAAGSRNRPDGRVLNWKSLRLKDDRKGMLPFFIEWGEGSVHPSTDAPAGCRLVRFEIAAPDVREFRETFGTLGIDVHVVKGEQVQLRATIAGARGEFTLTS